MSGELAHGRMLLEVRRPRDAVAALQRHLALAPEDPEGHRLLALARFGAGDPAGATAAAERAVGLAPEDAASAFVCGFVHARCGRTEPARHHLLRALAVMPDHAPSHALLGELSLAKGCAAAALAAARRALAVDPDDAAHHLLEAAALRATGDPAAALDSVRRGLTRAPLHAELAALEGELLLHRGDVDGAAESFSRSLRQQPHGESARRGLLEALRARHRGYAVVLRLRQGVVQLVRERRWLLLAACYLGCCLLAVAVAGRNGAQVLRGALIAVFLLPKELANALLLLHPFGRRVLRRSEVAFALATAAGVMAAAALGTVSWLTDAPALRGPAAGCGIGALLASALHAVVEYRLVGRRAWLWILVAAGLLVVVAALLASRRAT
ncbi:MAG: tetratricopeptide repeat protein [Planctomycetes bacterium]|nr:tetratricopeptide repeat protein [Planctomycetota bacterium]